MANPTGAENARVQDDAQGRIAELEGALESIFVGGNHIATYMDSSEMPYTAGHDEALEHYGADIRYDMWCCWKAIMEARQAIKRASTQKEE